MKWSHYSEAIFDCFSHTDKNIMVQACPGSGKTTNIAQLWSMSEVPTVYLVFNKHNQIEAQGKLPAKVDSDILTLNSLGHRAVMNTFGRVVLDNKKVYNIIRKTIVYERSLAWHAVQLRQTALARAVAIAKALDTTGDMPAALYEDMLSQHDLDAYEGMLSHLRVVLSESDSMTHVIDYADQLRLPVLYKCNMPAYHTALCDEYQDFSPVQAALLEVMELKRVVLVGDTHQSIYGFRGAMNDGMQLAAQHWQCAELPLSITYRCASRIVQDASAIYKGIEAWDESPVGTVRLSEPSKEDYTESDSLVLCRFNRPLIALAYDLLRRGIACYVHGRDIGQGLIALIKRQDCTSVRQLIAALEQAYSVEYAVASAKQDEAKMQRIEDRYSSALLFCQRCCLDDSPTVVIAAIEALFAEGKGICLSTVHKAKGLEAQSALLLDATGFDSCKQRCRHAWQREQEDNVRYVAVTRAKRELVYM